jgi:large subunit ribosomal protein L10
MVKQYKVDEVELLVSRLQERNNVILTNFSGVKVKDLSRLRKILRENNAEYRVVKNNLFKRALEKAGIEGLDGYLKGPIGVAFIKDEIAEVAKALKDFGKDEESFSYTAGILESTVYGGEEIKRIANLPSREVLLSQTMSLVNGPATGIAMAMNQVMASLARGIKAVAEANEK